MIADREAWLRMGHEERNEASNGRWLGMKITKKAEQGKCRAARCASEARGSGVVDGVRVDLCLRHLDEASDVVIDVSGAGGAYTQTMTDEFTQAQFTPNAEGAAATALARAQDLESDLVDFTIETQADLVLASDILHEVKAEWRAIEETRKSITKPLDDAKTATQALFKPAQTALLEIEAYVKELIATHVEAEQARNRALVATGAGALTTTTNEVKGITAVKRWVFEVPDPDRVPRALCSPDSAKIRDMMRAMVDQGVEPTADGITFTLETTITAR